MGRTSETPEKLKTALGELMWEQSYGSVTIDAICNAAGVKKGSFYHFYSTKAELALDAFERLWHIEARPWMDNAFSPSDPPLIRLRNWIQNGLEHTLQPYKEQGKILGCPFCNIGSEICNLEPDLALKINEILDRSLSYLVNALRDASHDKLIQITDLEETAVDMMTLVQGTVTRARITNDPTPLHHLTTSVSRLIGVDLNKI